ncbi:MAG: hypothetical protein J6U54_07735 [Clostridiales bacterium]|nr:hypothetical protein [Clostridiales bacterium]
MVMKIKGKVANCGNISYKFKGNPDESQEFVEVVRDTVSKMIVMIEETSKREFETRKEAFER